jgi:hypothetical protein
MNKPVNRYLIDLVKFTERLRELRDSDANPCNEENAEGLCPCHTFDQAIDQLENVQNILKTL